MRSSSTTKILVGLALGIAAGALVHRVADNADLLLWLGVPSRIFLALIKCIVAPLVFTMLVVGIGGSHDVRQLGRMGLRTIGYFLAVTTLALLIGLLAVNLVQPGAGASLPADAGAAAQAIAKDAQNLTPQQHLINVVPTSIVRALADNEVLQIVVFGLLFAVAVLSIGDRGRPVVTLCQSVADAMFVFTGYVMKLAPLAVGCAIAETIGRSGFDVLGKLALLVATLYGALLAFFALVLLPVALWTRLPLRRFLRLVREPALLAFTTTSSEAALPKALENMERLGVPRRVVGFVLPLGYSFNLDGSTLYLSLASVFVAQAAGRTLSVGEQVAMLATLLLSSKGIAAVPRASLVVLAGTLAQFHLPVTGVALILGVDVLMDMARTATNVIGNCLASCVIARWEGVLGEPAGDQAADEGG
jgi:proton glutamate symport protein